MERVGNILQGLVKSFGLDRSLAIATIRKQWKSIVGEPIALHSEPQEIKAGIIFITVDVNPWMQQLSFYKADMLAKLRPFHIRDIRFRLGEIDRPKGQMDGMDMAHPAFSDEERLYINGVIEAIQDDELKKKIRSIIEKDLITKKIRARSP